MTDREELNQPIQSKHHALLNRLSEMQGASYYATARSVLLQAESVIVAQEAEIAELKDDHANLYLI